MFSLFDKWHNGSFSRFITMISTIQLNATIILSERERERILKEFISLKLNYEKNKKKRRKIITKTNIDKTKTIYNIMKI